MKTGFFPQTRTPAPSPAGSIATIRDLPILSPHGHTQAAWFAHNQPFPDPAKLFVQPDHYVFRMLYSQGVSLEDLEIGVPELKDPRKVWRIFADHYYLFRGTPTRIWLDYAFQELFGLSERLSLEDCRPLLRHHRREAAHARVSATRSLRALPSRRPRHHRFAARFAGRSPGHPRFRMEGAHHPHFPPRSRRRS